MKTALRVTGLVGAAALMMAAAQASALAAAHHRAMGAMAPGPQRAEVTILSPSQGDQVPGAGWDLQVQIVVPARDAASIMASPALIGPTSPYFKPGPSHAFPGLVVTDTGTAAKLGGPSGNLAGLFQVVGVQKNFQGDTVIEADWLVGKPLFNAVAMPCIRAYVVSGVAPAKVPTPPTNADIGAKVAGSVLLSNVAKVDVAAASGSGM